MQLSQYQADVIEKLQTTEKNLVVGAVAGSGKTTLLGFVAETIRLQSPNAKVLYLAFNNEICTDVLPKLAPYGVDVSTFHKFGKSAITGKYKIDKYKYTNIVEEYEDQFEPLTKWQMTRIVDILRLWFAPITPDSVLDALIHCGIEMSDSWVDSNLESFTEILIHWIKKIGLNDSSKIDFVDMLVFPASFPRKYPLKKYDYILVDECQDLSPVMHQLLKHCKSRGARFVAVGDRHQAINGFAGADLNSFDNLITLLEGDELPLSVCYRCPQPVIDMAAKYVPHIEGTMKPGKVSTESMGQFIESVAANDLIICRRNAPLLQTAFKLLANGHRIIIKGRSFADFLLSYVKLVEKKDADFNQFVKTLDLIISAKLEKTDKEDRIELLNDVFNCLETLVEESEVASFKELKNLIDRLFDDSDKSNVITLSSFHRSKGLQNDKVYILLDKPLAQPGNGQESNLAYVAITRALSTLVMVDVRLD